MMDAFVKKPKSKRGYRILIEEIKITEDAIETPLNEMTSKDEVSN